jgi:hypothetical protein
MIEIIDKTSNKLIGKGIIELENKEEIKLKNNKKIYLKKEIIVNSVLFLLIIFSCISCSDLKNITEKDKEVFKKIDSIIYYNRLMLEIEYNENN